MLTWPDMCTCECPCVRVRLHASAGNHCAHTVAAGSAGSTGRVQARLPAGPAETSLCTTIPLRVIGTFTRN